MANNVLVREQTNTSGQTSNHSNSLNLNPSEESGSYDSLTVPLHPLRIKPAGNAYTATENIKLAAGIFLRLPDELIIQVLESLDAASLKWLGCTCKALYAFSRLEDLWKTLCIEYEIPSSNRFPASRCCNFCPELRDWHLNCFYCRLVCSIKAQEIGLFMVSNQFPLQDVCMISLDPFFERLLLPEICT